MFRLVDAVRQGNTHAGTELQENTVDDNGVCKRIKDLFNSRMIRRQKYIGHKEQELVTRKADQFHMVLPCNGFQPFCQGQQDFVRRLCPVCAIDIAEAVDVCHNDGHIFRSAHNLGKQRHGQMTAPDPEIRIVGGFVIQ